MLTHVLWFLALVVCAVIVNNIGRQYGAEAEKDKWLPQMTKLSQERADAEARYLGSLSNTAILRVQRDAAEERGRLVLEHKNLMVEALREEIADLRSRIPRPRAEVEIDGDDPPTVAQADRMAYEDMRNREQLRLQEDDAAPLIRMDASGDDEDDGN